MCGPNSPRSSAGSAQEERAVPPPNAIAIPELSTAAPIKRAGLEPIPGYRLVEPLGSGGFGEVWKCEAPGGLLKAIKFVYGALDDVSGDTTPAALELEALKRVKAIRHPFIVSLDRVEVLAGELTIVMELADKNLHDAREACRVAGQPGIPRDELLRYLQEAAEALDVMNFEYGLQHLDVKPRNLFLVSKHIKVADFGLVVSLPDGSGTATPRRCGVTPLYAAPETFNGTPSRQCDQYSLAIVYQELLTGVLPFRGKNGRHLMMQHLREVPDISTLTEADRAIVGRALAKDPARRFASCSDFIGALVSGRLPAAAAASDDGVTRSMRAPWQQATKELDETHNMPPGVQLTPYDGAVEAPCEMVFLGIVRQAPWGESWRVKDLAGQERLAYRLPAGLGDEGPILDRLAALDHPALPPREVARTVSGRVLVTAPYPPSLQDRFQDCWSKGRPGLPRGELLTVLRRTAEALDDLYRQHGMRHLGLSPRCIHDRDGRIGLWDFGLAELVWRHAGLEAARFNGRYTPPEPLGEDVLPSWDAYSLALIYSELLTGVHPRPQRSGTSVVGNRGFSRLHLDLLSAADREVIVRALHAEPARRFTRGVDLIRALEGVMPRLSAATPAPASLRPVVPVATLTGKPSSRKIKLLPRDELVQGILANRPGAPVVQKHQDFRYLLQPDNVLRHQCYLRAMPANLLPFKLAAFCDEWKARVVHENEEQMILRVEAPRGFLQACLGRAAGYELSVRLARLEGLPVPLCEATVQIRPFGHGTDDQDARNLAEVGPRLLASLRAHLKPDAERRNELRLPWPEPLEVYPVQPGQARGTPLRGRGKDISIGGIGFFLAQEPPAKLVYVHLGAAGQTALLAKVLRVRPHAEGWVEIGAAFADGGKVG